MRLSFRTKLVASYLILVVTVEVIALVALDRSLGRDLVRDLDARLEEQARAAAAWLTTAGHPDRLSHRIAGLVGARVTIVDRYGIVLGDSAVPPGDPPRMDAEGEPPEIAAARRSGVGRATRSSVAGEDEMHYVAVSARDDVVVRLAVPLASINATRASAQRRLLVAGLVGFVAALLLGVLAARLVVIPLRAMTRSAAQIAEGRHEIVLPATGKDEFGVLAEALRSMATQLREQIDHLRRQEQQRRQFLADASHELRTPVAAIQGYAQTLLEGTANEMSTSEGLEVIHRHAARIGKLVGDLLELSHIEARPAGGSEPTRVAIADVTANVERTVRERAELAGVTMVVDAPPVAVQGDPDRIEHVLENLVDNALKYGRRGGKVEIRARREGDRVLVAVADDGPGIAPEHHGRLFERFFRVDPSRSRELGGTGLGLAIVKELVESMGGTVGVESGPGRGCTFTFSLPAAPE